MNIKSILKILFPFLRSAAERLWSKTPKEVQQHLLNAVQLTQIIKDNLNMLPADIVKEIARATGLTERAVDLALAAMAYNLRLPDATSAGFITYVQGQAKAGLSDIGWNQLWDNTAKNGAIVLSGNKIDWLSLMLGLLQVALEVFKKR